MFDPWQSTLEEALAENQRAGNLFPLRQFMATRGVSKARPSIEGKTGGDVGLLIMGCMTVCARERLIVPFWLSQEFCKRVAVVSMGQNTSWDDTESFGKPWKKGTHKGAEWNRGDRAVQAWCIAAEFKKNDHSTPIDAGFFERIGEAMIPKLGKTEAEAAYYRAKKMMDDSEAITLDDIIGDLTTPEKFE